MRRLPWEAGFWVLSSLVLLGVGCLFHFVLIPALAPGLEEEYKNLAVFRSLDDWPGTYMILHPLVYGLFFAGAFRLLGGIKRVETCRQGLRLGACFGLGVFLVGSFPVYLLNYASFAVSPLMIMAWMAQSLCQYVVAGGALGFYSAGARGFTVPPYREPRPLWQAKFAPPPNVDWVEHPVVVLNSRVRLYHPGFFGDGPTGQWSHPDPEYLHSDNYLIVEPSEADFSRWWVCPQTWRIIEKIMGLPVGSEVTIDSMKGPERWKVLAVHVPRDGRRFRLTELMPDQSRKELLQPTEPT